VYGQPETSPLTEEPGRWPHGMIALMIAQTEYTAGMRWLQGAVKAVLFPWYILDVSLEFMEPMRQGDQSEIPRPHRVAPASCSRIWTEAYAHPCRKRRVVFSSQTRATPRFPSSAAPNTLPGRLRCANGLSHLPFRAMRIRSCKMLRQVPSRHTPDPGLGWIHEKVLADLSGPAIMVC
jgi:hypothetical protein